MLLRDADARNRWRWEPFFRPDEFRCHQSGAILVDTDFLDALWQIRLQFNRAMPINSGYRSPEHNAAVSDTGRTGPHTTGAAADVRVLGVDAFDLVSLAQKHRFTGIGVNQKGDPAQRFIHLDTLQNSVTHLRPRIWSY